MPDMQSSNQPSAGAVASANAFASLAPFGDDEPLGFECADPSLQIERWQIEARGATDAG